MVMQSSMCDKLNWPSIPDSPDILGPVDLHAICSWPYFLFFTLTYLDHAKSFFSLYLEGVLRYMRMSRPLAASRLPTNGFLPI